MGDVERPKDERERLLKASLVAVVQQRAKDGQSTALRDLHNLLDVPQPVALRIAHMLENEEILHITRNASDAFGSLVSIPASTSSGWLRKSKALRTSKR